MTGIEVELSTTSSNINLQEFVKNATWRELLMELVDTNKLDPWDIDLIKVVDGYIAAIRKMRILDLHVPANIMLAASILLRMKSETINIVQLEEEFQPEEELNVDRIIPEVPNLVPRLRLQPKRKITLNELMEALGDAIKINEKRELVVRERALPLDFVIEKDDIDEKIAETHKLVKENVDSEGVTTFAQLSSSFNSLESMLLKLFIPLLFLAHKGDISLMQDQFFNEIFVKLNVDNDGPKGEQL